MDEAPKRGRGRPKGSKNRVGNTEPPKVETPRSVPPGLLPMDDYRAADPLTLVARHYAMVDWQQQALRQEMKIGLGGKEGTRANVENGLKLVDLGNALMKTMNAHKQALALAETLKSHKTPAELLEIAIGKIEGQDLPTLEAIIRRLRKYRTSIAPTSKNESRRMGDDVTQVSAMEGLHALGDDDEV
jgi:hypothetical protein